MNRMFEFTRRELSTPVIALIVGAAIGSIGWIVGRIVDGVMSEPFISYSLTIDETCELSPDKQAVLLRVHNLSNTQEIRDVQFWFTVSNSASFHERAIVKSVGTNMPPREPVVVTTGSVNFPLIDLPPNGALDLYACFMGDDKPKFFVEQDENAVAVREVGVRTWLVRNELGVLVGMLVLVCVLLLIVLLREWTGLWGEDRKGANNGNLGVELDFLGSVPYAD